MKTVKGQNQRKYRRFLSLVSALVHLCSVTLHTHKLNYPSLTEGGSTSLQETVKRKALNGTDNFDPRLFFKAGDSP